MSLAEPPVKFDPAEQVTFDMSFGLVHLDGAPARVMVPADALQALCAAAGPDAAGGLGRAMGDAMGGRLRSRLGAGLEDVEATRNALRAMPFAAVIEHLAGELALVGLGALTVEQWGKALVLVIERSPLSGNEGGALLTAILAGALESATGARATVVELYREEGRVRFLVTNEEVAERVRLRLAEGTQWGQLLTELQAGGR